MEHNKPKKRKYGSKVDSMLKKQEKRKKYYYFLITFALILAITGILLVKNYIGYASFAGEAGHIYEIELYFEDEAELWSGVYGLALRVVGYTEPWSETLYGNNIKQKILLFDCMQPNIPHEIYASTVNVTNIDWNTIQAATPAEIDNWLGINSSEYLSATWMFTDNLTINVGSTNLTVPGTYTLVYNQSGSKRYNLGILKDGSGNLVFVTQINDSFDSCYYGSICNYQMILPIRNGTNETYYFFTDPNDKCQPGDYNYTMPEYTSLIGHVTDSDTGSDLDEVLVVVGTNADYTNGFGNYSMTTEIGNYHIFAVKSGYRTYHNTVNLTTPNSTYVHNIVMTKLQVGPYTNPSNNNPPAPQIPEVKEPIKEEPTTIIEVGYIISPERIYRKIKQENFIQEVINIVSVASYAQNLDFELYGDVVDIIDMDVQKVHLEKGLKQTITLTIFGKGEPRVVEGGLRIKGNVTREIPITIEIIDKDMLPINALLLDVEPYEKKVLKESDFKFKVSLKNLLTDQQYPVKLVYTIQNIDGTTTYWSSEDNIYLLTDATIVKKVKLPKEMEIGDYVLRVTAHYLDFSSGDSASFEVVEPWYEYRIFGFLAVWLLMLILLALIILILLYREIKKALESGKKYHMALHYSELPNKGVRTIWVGKYAETPKEVYFDIDNLKMHTIIAGSTGSGKTFSAQVMVEELLEKNVSVIVFDPTAQWTGLLRKCKDKSITRHYHKFGMSKNEVKAYSGNVREITDPYEEINITQYVKPGEISIFTLSKLEPEEIEIVVSSTIREVFKAKLKEEKELKLLLVYDEVHRLLPKFGGAGIGFLQMERGIREFRKWGVGLLLISQVLNDFVEQILANINTQIQMKTRDENDLDRIRVKFGKAVFQSMVKTRVGTGLVENADYNKGEPFFVEFRPVKHDIVRLSDEELEKYSKYNSIIDQVQFEIKQLEDLKQDTFNIKLESKLLLKKLKEGNFYVVDIYLEEVKKELENMWKKIRKKPQKLQKKRIDKKEIEKEVEKAEEERKKELARAGKVKSDFKDQNDDEFNKTLPFGKALHFENGASVLSLQELRDVLESMTISVFKKHVNNDKNDVADWIKIKVKNQELAKKIRGTQEKDTIIKILDQYKNNSEWFQEQK